MTRNNILFSIRRFKNRLKYLFSFNRAWYWEGESCDMCGRCYRVFYEVANELWMKINKTESGCLCLECLIEKANDNGIEVHDFDIKAMILFVGKKWKAEYLKKQKQESPRNDEKNIPSPFIDDPNELCL